MNCIHYYIAQQLVTYFCTYVQIFVFVPLNMQNKFHDDGCNSSIVLLVDAMKTDAAQ